MEPRENFFFKKSKLLPRYSDLEQNFQGLLATKNGSVPKLPFHVPRGTFWEKHCFTEKKKNFLFQTLSQTRSKNDKIFAAFYKLHITWPEELFRKIFLRFQKLFYLFRTFGKKILERLSKLLSRSPEDSFEKKRFFSKNVIFSIIHGLRAFNFKTFAQKISCDVSKLHSTCPKKRSFEEEQFLEKPIAFLFIFGPWTETSLNFVEKKCGIVARFGNWAAHRNFLTKTRLLKEKNTLVFFRL